MTFWIVLGVIVAGGVLAWIVTEGSRPAGSEGEVTTRSGLKHADLKVGDGKEARKGDNVEVHYTGRFLDGKKFESSRDGGRPYEFPLGAGEVIKGWDEGIAGMKVGGVRKLIIPPDLAYGPRGKDDIPPNAELHFEVELVNVR